MIENWLKMTPKYIVEELDKYIVGQKNAKRSVAIAIRNRLRRRMLPEETAREIAPKNIMMIGPTGVGKTEIARRLANLVEAPFVKVEATKFTEVGYVGRDVESMVRDLVEVSVQMVKKRYREKVSEKAAILAEERLVDILLPEPGKKRKKTAGLMSFLGNGDEEKEQLSVEESIAEKNEEEKWASTRSKLREMLRDGKLDERTVEIQVNDSSVPRMEIFAAAGLEDWGANLQEMLGGLMPKKPKKRKVSIIEARKMIEAEEAEKLVDMDAVTREGLDRAQQDGIIFLDEMDKIVAKGKEHGHDVSREGVQRDLLPVVEGSTVSTKYGPVSTDHILFIGAGAFHSVKPSDLIPELQGRFPIRVELEPLSERDLERILVSPRNALTKQYQSLLEVEGLSVDFSPEGVAEIARLAAKVNSDVENIGARRLHTMMEALLEDISFSAEELSEKNVVIDANFVAEKLTHIVKSVDVTQYLL